ncbi:L-iditol 2-dehydrogenase [Alternaria panax]|uniref:L-iditol 2-dehydrogenase n=1 Tax=Alternaria panax TaxID=48097 RepID=A0AAD4FB41_9PLEO|nr:L-iditol 2-dehydrogenase [Alternaria panax]
MKFLSHLAQLAFFGTDLHYYQNGRKGIHTVEGSLVLGHEASDDIIAVGSTVACFKVGDRVVFEPQLSCLSCKRCRSGRYNLCNTMRFNGSASADPPAQGSLQKVLNHPPSLVYHLPDELRLNGDELVEPLSVALHSVRKARLEAGQTVLITEAGAIGSLRARMAKTLGASSVTMMDVDADRLKFAMEQGFANGTVQIPFHKEEGESGEQSIAHEWRRMCTDSNYYLSILLECN